MGTDQFVGVYQAYYRAILTVAHQRLGSFADAEDATAEVFRIAWRAHLDGTEFGLPWLYQTLRNVIGNEYRRRSRADALTERVGQIEFPLDHVSSPDDAIEIRHWMQKLPELDRELIRMAYWEDLSREEIARVLGCTAATVRVRLFRARRRLETLLVADSVSSKGQGPPHG